VPHSFCMRLTQLALLFGSLAGCGSSGPDLGQVTGTVTLDGEPIRGGSITFTPNVKDAGASYGSIDKEGKYVLKFNRDRDGAAVGEHTVEIDPPEKPSKSDIAEAKEQGKPAPEFINVKIPKKYSEPGALNATVKAGPQVIDFKLESK